MKKTIRKWFWVWDFEKEERWLNEMALQGWALEKVGFAKYHFAACEPGEYTVRLELREHDEAYLSFMRDMGAEYIGRYAQWIYFRRKSELGEFDLFSDLDSRIAHLSRIGKGLGVIALANLCIGLCNCFGSGASFGWINLLCATLLTYALGRIHGKKESLELERQVRE